MASDGTGSVQITSGTEWAFSPAWSPDRTQIAFTRDISGIGLAFHIWVVDANGDHLVQLTSGPGQDSEPSWSPDGTKIAFVSNRDGNYEIYTMNADGANLTRLTNNAFFDWSPKWSPDGGKILFVSLRASGVRMLYTMDPDGSNQTQLTNIEAFDGDWSPDGSQIAFTGVSSSSWEQICVMDSGGTGVHCLTDPNESNGQPTWSPDGQMIAFGSGRNEPASGFEIFRMNADGSNQTQLTTTIGDPNNESDQDPDWGGLAPALPTPSVTPSPMPVGGSATLTVSQQGVGSASVLWLVALLTASVALLAGAAVWYRRFARKTGETAEPHGP
jgi:tol-pal system beta propeller repeat protein TolB